MKANSRVTSIVRVGNNTKSFPAVIAQTGKPDILLKQRRYHIKK